MANKKISALTDLGATPAVGDILPITDISEGITKKVTVADLVAAAPQGDLVSTNNLSDLANAGTARTNLGLGTSAALDVGTADTNVVQLADVGGTVKLPAVDASQLTGIEGVQILSTNETGGTKYLREDGDGTCSWQPAGADVDGPLTIALRGTDNPHIGASPDQSFNVMDNPNKSAMVVADADGNITYILKDSAAEVRVAKGVSGTPSRFALASDLPAFVLENDSGEPDIEVTDATTAEKISVISGDSDTKGANGLPIRQGYNLPDIGGNPSPLLISGGTIA
jgi:hypothetical protein